MNDFHFLCLDRTTFIYSGSFKTPYPVICRPRQLVNNLLNRRWTPGVRFWGVNFFTEKTQRSKHERKKSAFFFFRQWSWTSYPKTMLTVKCTDQRLLRTSIIPFIFRYNALNSSEFYYIRNKNQMLLLPVPITTQDIRRLQVLALLDLFSGFNEVSSWLMTIHLTSWR